MNEIITDFSIKTVTIYPQSCRINRVKKINFKKGENNLIVKNLPHLLSENSIRVEISKNSRLKIEDIYCEEKSVDANKDTDFSVIKSELDSLLEKKCYLESEYYNLSHEIALFTNKTKFRDYFKNDIKPIINSKSWDGFLNLFKNKIKDNRDKTRETVFKLIDIEEKIKSTKNNFEKYLSTNNKKEKFITIVLSAEIDIEEEINVHYLQNNAGWYPSYTLRAEPQDNNIELSMFAMIKQLTGEHWKNIEILLSTANPLSNCSIPEIRSKIIKEESAKIIDITPPPSTETSYTMDSLLDAECESKEDSDEYLIDVKRKPNMMRKSIIPPMSQTKTNAIFDKKVEINKGMMSQSTGMGMGVIQPNISQSITNQPNPIEIASQEQMHLSQNDFSTDKLSNQYKEYKNYLYTNFSPESKIDSTPQIKIERHFLNGIPPDKSLGGYDYRYKVASLINEINSIDIPTQLGVDIKNLKLDLIYTTTPIEKENVYLKGRFTNNGSSPFPSGPAQVFADNQFLGNIMLPTLATNQYTSISLGIERDVKILRKENSERRTTGMFVGNDIITDYHIEIELQSFKSNPIVVEVFDRIPISVKEKEISIIDENFEIKPIKITKRKIVLWNIEINPGEKKVIKFGYSIKHNENFRLTITKSNNCYYESEE